MPERKRLEAKLRSGDEKGTASARRLRRAGCIPAVIYGKELGSLPIKIDRRALRQAFHHQPPLGEQVEIVVSMEEQERFFPTVVKEVQRDPLSLEVIHLDFHHLRDEPVEALPEEAAESFVKMSSDSAEEIPEQQPPI